MPDDDSRPDPDVLLADLAAPAPAARLRVFLGMCPGVGKTFAMLQAARAHSGEVVAGVVETHSRRETAELLDGLEILPLHEQEYRGVKVREMDLDALLARRPAVALVDELAHTNAPGSRHPKRHQDVTELLAAGISVWTTLNIQHVESRADVVAELTGVTVRETVPDSLLDRADEVILIDLPPEQLRQRLQEGRVYQGERAAAAGEQFFRMGNLTALRELALRYTAEHAGRDFRELAAERKRTGPLRTSEKLLVAISASPTSESLIRWTRRVAGMLDATWLAVTVDTGRPLGEAARTRLAQHIALVQALGGEVVRTSGEELSTAILAVARERHATQIVVGKPARRAPWGLASLLDHLITGSGDIDVHVVRPRREDAARRPEPDAASAADWPAFWRESAAGALLVAALTGACWFAEPFMGYLSVALVYLLAVVLAALRLGRGPILLTAALSALAWDFLFIPPRFTFYILETHDIIMCVTYFVVALVVGQVTARLRLQQRLERRRERRTETLLGFTQLLAGAPDDATALERALTRLHELFPAPLALHQRNDDDHSLLREPVTGSTLQPSDKEWSVAAWVQANRQAAGRFTTTLPDSRVTCLPMQTRTSIMGVLTIVWPEGRTPGDDERTLLEALAAQLGLALEKEHLTCAIRRADMAGETNRLHKALLDSVSHELKTPIAALRASLDLLDGPADARSSALHTEMQHATRRLERVTTQLLDMTRIEGGNVQPQRDWCDVEELLLTLIAHQLPPAARPRVTLSGAEDFPPVFTDAGMLETMVLNLLLNALVWSPPETPVELHVARQSGAWSLTVRDHGPGLAPEDLPRVFQKFYRAPTAPAGGAGLGLSIVRGFAQALGAGVTAGNADGGGAVFTLSFPP